MTIKGLMTPNEFSDAMDIWAQHVKSSAATRHYRFLYSAAAELESERDDLRRQLEVTRKDLLALRCRDSEQAGKIGRLELRLLREVPPRSIGKCFLEPNQ